MTYLSKLGTRGGLFVSAAVIAIGLPLVQVGFSNVDAAESRTRHEHRESLKKGACRCESITATPRTGNAPLTVSFKVKPFFGHEMPADRLDEVSVLWDFGDGQTARTDGKFTITHTYKKAGNYTAKAKLAIVDATMEQKPAPCAVQVKVTTPDTPEVPEVPETPGQPSGKGPTQLPNTGAAEAAAATGAGGLGIAVRSYLRSRKNLLSSLLNK